MKVVIVRPQDTLGSGVAAPRVKARVAGWDDKLIACLPVLSNLPRPGV